MLPAGQIDWFAPQEDRAADHKTLAEREWRAPLKPPAPQKPCDDGIFSDVHTQKKLF